MSRSPVPPALPGYEILQLLGAGGTSTVWLARQLSLDRVVAIKILSADLLADPAAREQFQKEARAAARLSHPAIVGILDFGEHGGTLYYVMEYVDGTNLAGWLAENQRMAHGQVLKLADIVAGALDAVWRETALIHCDVKPGNILLGTDGAVKLTDLGLARVAGSAATRDPEACIEGTPTYIAPEQIEGREPDCRTDIYSLGLTLYHLLTGAPPFEGRSLDAILEAQQSDYLPDPCDILPHLPVSYGWLLAKMTAKDPAKRPHTWAEVLKDIHQIQSGKSPLPPYPADDESTILLNPRHRPSARAHTINLSAATKKAITLSASQSLIEKQKRSSASRAASSGGGGFLRFLIFLLLFGGALFAVWHFGLKDNREFRALLSGQAPAPGSQPPAPIVGGTLRKAGEPAAAQAPAPAPPPETAAGTESSLPAELPPLSASAGTVTPGAWNHPGFIQAANLFNQALTNYQAHLRKPDPQDPALASILADAQYAAVLFENIRTNAPFAVPVTSYANQCYQLVNDARRARLTLAAKKNLYALAPKKRHETLAPYPTPVADPTDHFSPRHMQFGYAWDTLPAPIDRPETPEFVFLLSTVAESTPDTRAQAGLYIHGPLDWLMPLTNACRVLAVKPGPRIPVEGAPFPYGGFFMHSFNAGRLGALGPGQPPYPTLRLITDCEDRLVAVQLVDEKPAAPLHSSPMSFSPVSKIMDFVTGLALPEKGDVRVSHRTLKGEGTLRIDTEAADFTAGPDGQPLFRSVLLLPQAVANNLLYHLLGATE